MFYEKIFLHINCQLFYFNYYAIAGLEGYTSSARKINNEVSKLILKNICRWKRSTNKPLHGRTYFFISESGRGFGYSYCPQTYIDGCEPNPNLAKRILVNNI